MSVHVSMHMYVSIHVCMCVCQAEKGGQTFLRALSLGERREGGQRV